MTKQQDRNLKSAIRNSSGGESVTKTVRFKKKPEVLNIPHDTDIKAEEGISYQASKYNYMQTEIYPKKAKHSLINYYVKNGSSEEDALKKIKEVAESPDREKILDKIKREKEIEKLQKDTERSEKLRYYNRKSNFTKQHLKNGASNFAEAEQMADRSIVAEDMKMDHDYTSFILEQRQNQEKDCFCTIS
ncbi:MAG: hypothetical protein PQ612_08055 [Rickettsiales bacterium]|nr:hypothetical protein [Pseudomonadota bacterium]MDA0966825.1 hypothetical protein [Pseudomonadota bacterium]MDG4543499.1 hypothetical protein [Rickettsiales bacterium]MDG4546107.1 hypothetical protein [Rickettsiales bacterium]MDG4547580.1 hypothetical protein [Rickettsiales bacterium]